MTERSGSRGIDRTVFQAHKRVCLQCLLSDRGLFCYAVKPFRERKIIMKRTMALLISLACMTAAFASCSNSASESSSSSEAATTAAATEEATTEAETETTTEESTEEATEAEDDEENYDTGDASLDNIRNQDEIGENELLVLSFGTSFNDSRRLTIGAIEGALDAAFPDYSVRRGFTSNIIIDHVNSRDGVLIDDVDAALQRAVDNGVKNLVVQPTHLMNGLEYDELNKKVASYADGALAVAMSTVADTSDSRDFSDVEITGMLDKVIVPKASFLIANILPEKDSFFRIHIGPWISADGTVMCQVLGEFINNFSKNDVIHAKGCLSERLFMPGLPKLYIVPSYILERDRLNPDLKKEPVVEKDSGGWEY